MTGQKRSNKRLELEEGKEMGEMLGREREKRGEKSRKKGEKREMVREDGEERQKREE